MFEAGACMCAYVCANVLASLQNYSDLEMVYYQAGQMYQESDLIRGRSLKHVHKQDMIKKLIVFIFITKNNTCISYYKSTGTFSIISSSSYASVLMPQLLSEANLEAFNSYFLPLNHWKCCQTTKVRNDSPAPATPEGSY